MSAMTSPNDEIVKE